MADRKPSSMFTGRHYKFLTEFLGEAYRFAQRHHTNDSPEVIIQQLIENLARELERKDRNPRFDPERFVRTCLGTWEDPKDLPGPPPGQAGTGVK